MPPRERPTLLDVSTNIGCSCACSYCPQRLVMREYAKRSNELLLTLDSFCRCVGKIPPDMTVAFAGISEPWLNPDCTPMVEWAHGTGHAIQLFTTTVGMKPDDVERLLALPAQPAVSIVLHLPSAEGHEHIPVAADYLSLVGSLLESGLVDHCHCHGSELHPAIETVDAKGLWGRQTRTRTGGALVEYVAPQTRAGNIRLPGVNMPARKSGRLRCLRSWDHLLLPNGDVAVCSLDYGMRHVLGNLLDQDYQALFEGEQYRLVLRGLGDDSVDALCRTCECASGAGVLPRVRAWCVRELRASNTLVDVLAIAPRFLRTSIKHILARG